MKFSKTQYEFLAKAHHGAHLAYGAVRSGKTFVQIYALLGFLVGEDSLDNIAILITAKKRDSIERNLFTPMKEILSSEPELEPYFKFSTNPYRVTFTPKNIQCFCEGANDDGAEGKIRGMTIQAWLGDEVTLYPQSFFQQCFARLSAGARLALLTCNPDSLTHYVYRDYVAPKRVQTYPFSLTDNHTLHADYLEMLKTNYTGVQYTRFIEGQWGGNEEDLVVPEFVKMRDSIIADFDQPEDFHPTVAMDIGWKDWTFAVLGHYNPKDGRAYIDNELVIKKGMTTDQLARSLLDRELDTWGRQARRRWSDIDYRLIEDFNRLHGISMLPTRKDNKDAQINALRVLIRNDQLRIHPRCQELIGQLAAATWDKGKKERIFSRSMDFGHFDGVDALLYFTRNLDRSGGFPDISVRWEREGRTVSPKYQKKESEWKSLIPKMTHVMDGGTGLSRNRAWASR